ncbi:16408_t:CDS:2 [Funneliformis geosporum]|uniref:14328_t:CDS:1 n=1 Tax=Funneliformis geosporum TaxID=1117311 RepID=A0A9W4SE49_9GLOM|nr:14328_t:CDS:2 [Funneliformis geosporum]CAI2177940.1 16408_t:CDS:2 [Funneliformis geosporum]
MRQFALSFWRSLNGSKFAFIATPAINNKRLISTHLMPTIPFKREIKVKEIGVCGHKYVFARTTETTNTTTAAFIWRSHPFEFIFTPQ